VLALGYRDHRVLVQPAPLEQRPDLGVAPAEVAERLKRIETVSPERSSRRKKSPFARMSPPVDLNHSTVSASSTSLQMYA
jgi:hypothetical protein